MPKRHDIDAPLIVGAAVFGVGWGLGGYCPAPAVVALSTLSPGAITFFASMLAGMLAFALVEHLSTRATQSDRESAAACG